MKKLKVILLALFLVIGVSGMGSASTMTSLLAGDSITVGDKLFSNWSFEVIVDNAGTFDVDSIEVVGLDADPMNPGIRIQGIAGAASPFSVDDYNWLDVEFTFKVSVLNPGYLIDGVSSSFWGSMSKVEGETEYGYLGIGDDIATDSASFDPVLGGDVTSFDPWIQWIPESGINDYPDSVVFAGLSEIWVKKDILLISSGGNVTVGWIDQNFHQTAVPEPSTMLLLGAGLLGLCGVTRKKRE